MPIDVLRQSFAFCGRVTRTYAKSFSFASHVLPAEKRMASYAIYAFCRHADNIADSAGAEDRVSRIAALRGELAAVYAGATPGGMLMPAFQATIERYHIPQEYFLDLLEGVEMDLTLSSIQTFGELHRYCYRVASTVGLAMSRVFGVTDEQALAAAADLGVAMQLTNILRDIAEDRARGRCYLPREEMEHFGYSMDDLAAGVLNDRFVALMAHQVARARRYYRSADGGIPSITPDGSRFCVVLMSRTYEAILDVIAAREYDVFSGRAATSPLRKLGIAVSALAGPLPETGFTGAGTHHASGASAV